MSGILILSYRLKKVTCFTLFFDLIDFALSPQPDVRLRYGLDQNVAF